MRISIFHAWIALGALMAGAAIFFFTDDIPVLRYYCGDIVVVIFLYTVIKAVFPAIRSAKIASGVMVFAVSIEFMQYAGIPEMFDTSRPWVRLTLGSTFEWLDIPMYAIGLIIVLLAENLGWEGRNYNL